MWLITSHIFMAFFLFLQNSPLLETERAFAGLPTSTHLITDLPHPLTASQQFAFHNKFPVSFFLTKPQSSHLCLRHVTLSILLCLAGNIETNPGPSTKLCTLNIRSFNTDHSIYLQDIISTHQSDLVALTETWLNTNKHTPSELASLTPSGFELVSCPRPSGNGGGVAFLVRQHLPYTFDTYSFSSFEAISVTLKTPTTKFSVLNIYRPPDTSNSSQSFSTFLNEFQSILSDFATLPHEFVITGDFNIHVDDPSNRQAKQFMSLLSCSNLTQHVTFPTHTSNHILDLVITSCGTSLNPSVSFSPLSPSDHVPVFTCLSIDRHSPPHPTVRSFRCLTSIILDDFIHDISLSSLITQPPSSLSELVNCYDTTLSNILNKHAPLVTKCSRKNYNPWYSPALRSLKSACRSAENIWKRTRSTTDWLSLKQRIKTYHDSIRL